MTQDRESAPVTPIWDFVTFQQDSQNQNRRGITLRNGLTAHLCHDPLADDAQVQMVVSVGYCDDPDDMAGLAHLTEHLVFMGTKQFPEENAFTEVSTYFRALELAPHNLV
ncbi:hypothetical protein NLI96_g6481 [Meripilus lineatus]|uniref:Peptidase M16 N-terminal domain-containing protein n=1 Tax=Meripilus lineatus TaxID=2056292 RepID=A0AAD5YDU6_9APHY|nr:hypothetical protein NLI96_g6481 [Physisporinus lineatus]